MERDAGSFGTLTQHVTRVPGRRSLFLERFVGVIDDDRRREVGHGRKRRDASADDDALPLRGPSPRGRTLRV